VLTLFPGGVRAEAPRSAARQPAELTREAPAAVKVQLSGADETVPLARGEDGSLLFLLHHHDGTVEALSPEAFARRVHDEQAHRGFWLRFLNITSPVGVAWVALGLLGQILFTGRMLFQWIASEKSRRSVVPTAFWWMSLAGATLLLAYFIWRKDVVGVLGQATGWLIYLRNLWLIHVPRPSVVS